MLTLSANELAFHFFVLKFNANENRLFCAKWIYFNWPSVKCIAKNIKANVNWLVLAGCRVFIRVSAYKIKAFKINFIEL